MPWPTSVRRSDLRIEFFRAGGPGGQNQNKRDTGCRITHLPTGRSAESREHRTQALNRGAAFKRLAQQLIPMMVLAQKPKIEPAPEMRRTYNEHRRTVQDTNHPGRVFDYDRVLKGELPA